MKTTKILLASTFLVLVSACSGSCSCGSNNDDDGEGGSGGATTTATTAGSGGNGTGGDGSGGGTTAASGGGSGTGGDTGATTGTGGGTAAGYCTLGCVEAIDCCGGAPDCPSEEYPYNWTCDEGVCSNAGCTTDEECTFGGALPDYECFPTGAGGACLEACTVDEDCTAPLTCTGELDGRTYCTTEAPGCETDEDCGGYGICQEDGSCTCAGDEECTADGAVCVE